MNILMLYAFNPGLASGIIAFDLFKELQKQGHNVKLLVNRYDPAYPKGIVSMETFYYSFWKKSKLRYKLDGLNRKLKLKKNISIDNKYDFLEFQEQKILYKTKRLLKKANLKPDVIIILFAKRFINTKNIFELYEKTHARIYWLMYDMAPLTGGCHYAWDCKGYQHNCGNCPGLFSSDPFDTTFTNFEYKRKFIDRTDIQLIAGSEWQYRQAKLSSLFRNKTIHKILSSIDSVVFKPLDKEKLRLEMGISNTKKIVFFGSIELISIRKGMFYLLESLKILKEKIKNTKLENNILLLIAGNGFERIKDFLPFEYYNLGMLDNTYGIASAYQLADIFVCPSIEDSGPTMINQSIMCGTPVVSFEMGVALDLVINGKTGYRAKLKNSDDFAHGMYTLLSMPNSEYELMTNNCRKLALELYEPSVNINNWVKLLNSNK